MDEEEAPVFARCMATVGHMGDTQCELQADHKYGHVAKAGTTTYTWGGGDLGRLYEPKKDGKA